MARAEQLCLKTNQFNLRTQRHNRIKLEEMCQSGDFIVFIASLKDRHGDHGNVGLVIAQKLRGIPAYFIDTFLVSCRVLGKHLESWMLSYLKKCIQEMEGKYLVGEYIPTEKNQVAGNFLTSHGFIPLNPDTIPISLVPCESQQNQENNLLMADVGNLVIPNLEIYNA